MSYKEIQVYSCICERCYHKWLSRKERLPIICPSCKSAYWNIKRLIRAVPIGTPPIPLKDCIFPKKEDIDQLIKKFPPARVVEEKEKDEF